MLLPKPYGLIVLGTNCWGTDDVYLALEIAGIISAFRAMTKNRSWIPSSHLNLLVMAATFFVYFAQNRTIERWP